MKYNHYSDATKLDAVKDLIQGEKVQIVMVRYGITSREQLRRWRMQYQQYGGFPDGRGKGGHRGGPRRIDTSQMSKDEYIQYLEMENDILKLLRSLSNSRQKLNTGL